MVQNFVQFSIYVEELVGHEEQTEYWKLGNYHVSLPLRRKLQNTGSQNITGNWNQILDSFQFNSSVFWFFNTIYNTVKFEYSIRFIYLPSQHTNITNNNSYHNTEYLDQLTSNEIFLIKNAPWGTSGWVYRRVIEINKSNVISKYVTYIRVNQRMSKHMRNVNEMHSTLDLLTLLSQHTKYHTWIIYIITNFPFLLRCLKE